MGARNNQPRRVRIERNIYRRASGAYEVGFKDGSGRQRWRTVDGGITAARAMRDELLSQRARGERVTNNSRLRFGDAAESWLEGPVIDLTGDPVLLPQRARAASAYPPRRSSP